MDALARSYCRAKQPAEGKLGEGTIKDETLNQVSKDSSSQSDARVSEQEKAAFQDGKVCSEEGRAAGGYNWAGSKSQITKSSWLRSKLGKAAGGGLALAETHSRPSVNTCGDYHRNWRVPFLIPRRVRCSKPQKANRQNIKGSVVGDHWSLISLPSPSAHTLGSKESRG